MYKFHDTTADVMLILISKQFQVKTSVFESWKMLNQKKNLVLRKHEVKSSVKFTGLSPTKYIVSFSIFNNGSRSEDLDLLPFAYVSDNTTK